MLIRLTSTCFLILALATNYTRAQSTKAEKIKAYLNKANEIGLFNGNVLVVDGGKEIYKAAIGYADASKQVPLTTQYRFHIGSIAKEFNAVGIMVLKEQNRISLNDKVAKFFPDLPSWAQKISIKNLLQYTSGLPDIKWQTVHGDEDNWNDLKALQQLDFDPGTSYAYNNNNTFLQRKIIEKVTGVTFKDFVEQKLLIPVGINAGIVDPTDNDSLIAKSFNNEFKQDALIYPITGWTCLTVDDFYKWSLCIKNFDIITAPSTREIITPVSPDKQAGLGSGSMIGDKLIMHVHDGTAVHYQALELSNTVKDRTIILLTNQRQGNVYEIKTAIEAILDGKPYEQLKKTDQ